MTQRKAPYGITILARRSGVSNTTDLANMLNARGIEPLHTYSTAQRTVHMWGKDAYEEAAKIRMERQPVRASLPAAPQTPANEDTLLSRVVALEAKIDELLTSTKKLVAVWGAS